MCSFIVVTSSHSRVQDPFQVSDNMGRFSRLRERHVFLFEKVVIVSKKVEAPVQKRQKKNDTYVYKDHIQVNGAYSGTSDKGHSE